MLKQSVHHANGGFPDLGKKHPKAGYRYYVGGRRFNLGHDKLKAQYRARALFDGTWV